MKFNYQTEKKKFDEAWEETESTCRKYGMQEEKIQELKAYDWDEFKRERIFCIHIIQIFTHLKTPPNRDETVYQILFTFSIGDSFFHPDSTLSPGLFF